MEIIPVIDLKSGLVVHAVAGHREKYQPIKSELTDGATPAQIASAFSRLGFKQVYVADLDAIQGAEPDWQSYSTIKQSGLDLWVDHGVNSIQDAASLVDFDVQRIVIGSESIAELSLLSELIAEVGERQILFSVDMKNGEVMSPSPIWKNRKPSDLISRVNETGVRQILLLDLARVGTSQGLGTEQIVRDTKRRCDASVFVGGGIRNDADVEQLASTGCDGVLVSTALHRCQLSRYGRT